MGDVVRTLPALRVVRQRLPEAHLAWVVEEPSLPILDAHPELDGVFVLDRGRLAEELGAPDTFFQGIERAGRLVKELRRGRFTASLDFQGTLKSGLIAWASGAALRAGYDRRSVKEGNHLFNNRIVPLPSHPVHRVERNLALLDAIGVPRRDVEVAATLPIRTGDSARADRALAEAGASGEPFVFLYPGSSRRQAYKRYPAERFREVVERLLGAGVEVIVGQGPGEEAIAHAVVPSVGPRPRLLPAVPLLAMAEVIRRAKVFVGCDTGPMHLAWIQGVPVVALFGPTDPILNAPWGNGHAVLDAAAAQPFSGHADRDQTGPSSPGNAAAGTLARTRDLESASPRRATIRRVRGPSAFDGLHPAEIVDATLALMGGHGVDGSSSVARGGTAPAGAHYPLGPITGPRHDARS